MGATLKVQSPKLKSYAVPGATLVERMDYINRKGPVDPNEGKRFASVTTTKLKFDPKKAAVAPDGKVKKDKKTGWYVAKAKVKSLAMVLESEIELPKASPKGLSWAAAKEWIRFMLAVSKHELEHVKMAGAESKKIAGEIDKMRAEGFAETERDAIKQARDNLIADIFHTYNGSLDRRFAKVHKAFDSRSHHGPVLNTSVA